MTEKIVRTVNINSEEWKVEGDEWVSLTVKRKGRWMENFIPTQVDIDFSKRLISISLGSVVAYTTTIYLKSEFPLFKVIPLDDHLYTLVTKYLQPYMRKVGWFFDESVSDFYVSADGNEMCWDMVYTPYDLTEPPIFPDVTYIGDLLEEWKGEEEERIISLVPRLVEHFGEVRDDERKITLPLLTVEVYCGPIYVEMIEEYECPLEEVRWSDRRWGWTKMDWVNFVVSYLTLRGEDNHLLYFYLVKRVRVGLLDEIEVKVTDPAGRTKIYEGGEPPYLQTEKGRS